MCYHLYYMPTLLLVLLLYTINLFCQPLFSIIFSVVDFIKGNLIASFCISRMILFSILRSRGRTPLPDRTNACEMAFRQLVSSSFSCFSWLFILFLSFMPSLYHSSGCLSTPVFNYFFSFLNVVDNGLFDF